MVEDGAQSLGATYHGRQSCSLSTIGCTSFFPSKPLGCYGDGGACFTNDAELAKAMREIRNHGQDRRYHHPRIALNGRLDTLQAAILLAKLEIFADEVRARGEIGARYTEQLARIDGITTPHLEAWNTSVYAQYTLQVDRRDQVCERLREQGIPTAIHYPIPLNQQPAFSAADRQATPVAAKAAAGVFSIPMHPYLQPNEQDRVIEAVSHAMLAAPAAGSLD